LQSLLPGTIPLAPRRIIAAVALAVTLTLSAYAHAAEEETPQPASTLNLPDAPSAVIMHSGESSSLTPPAEAAFAPDPQNTQQSTPHKTLLARVKFVGTGQIAPKQTAADKFLLGARESVTPFAMLGWAASAGWSHLLDLSPNYGTNSQAFAQRLGAAAALNTSKEIFSDSVLASAFHQDPRYYQMGPSHKLLPRAIYAATRPVIGRTDAGRTIPNFAFILGTGGAAALTHTYYPERNVTAGQVMQTWATSLAGSAGGYLVSEFGGEIIGWLHIRKHE